MADVIKVVNGRLIIDMILTEGGPSMSREIDHLLDDIWHLVDLYKKRGR